MEAKINADPGLPRAGGAKLKGWDTSLLFWLIFPKNA